jgi:hypothetical protein
MARAIAKIGLRQSAHPQFCSVKDIPLAQYSEVL